MSPPEKDPLALHSEKSDASAPADEHEPSLPPPPYEPADSTDTPPGYSGLASDDSTPVHAATAKIPPTLNGYWQWKWTRTMLLGPTAEEKLYAVSTNSRMFSSKQSIVLRDGPSDKHPVVASLESDVTGRKRPFIITIPSRSETTPQDTVVEVHGSANHKYSMEPPFSFSCVVGEGKGTLREEFEWRRSNGNEIHELARYSSGWKLVRLSQISDAAGGSRARRERGFTSDGREVVAVLAHNSSMSLTKGFQFAFMGSGLLGTLGECWEMTALISAVQMFNVDAYLASAAGAAS